MKTAWERIETWLAETRRNQAWLAEQLDITEGAVGNWRKRGVPRGRYMEIAELMGESTDYLEGKAPRRGQVGGAMSPMALELAAQFDRLPHTAQLKAFSGCIAVISRAAD